jgi:hypothetical protein
MIEYPAGFSGFNYPSIELALDFRSIKAGENAMWVALTIKVAKLDMDSNLFSSIEMAIFR